MLKKILIFIFMIVLLGESAFCAPVESDRCTQARQNAEKAMMDVSNEVYDIFIPKAEDYQDAGLTECLDGITSLDLGIDLGVPSVGDALGSLIDNACSMAVQDINSYIGEVNSKLGVVDVDEMFFEATTTQNPGQGGAFDVDKNSDGDQIADDLWDEISKETPW